LYHLLGLDGKQVGLPVYLPEIELRAVCGHEAAFGVDRVEVFVAELDVEII
jgi:hypothetical protein